MTTFQERQRLREQAAYYLNMGDVDTYTQLMHEARMGIPNSNNDLKNWGSNNKRTVNRRKAVKQLMDDYTRKEIAEELDCDISTVRKDIIFLREMEQEEEHG